ncbi:MAG: hypothetical protein COB65_02665 [Thalassobium sp.]|nr:MAG: hypothetical protein COB65_02665 [Thalassobium sp.]
MESFSYEDYLEKLLEEWEGREGELELLPAPDDLVMHVFSRKSETIKKWKNEGSKGGKLQVVEIDRVKHVTMQCVLEKYQKVRADCEIVTRRLLKHLDDNPDMSKDDVTLHYAETMEWVGLNVRKPVDRKDFSLILGEVSKDSYNKTGFFSRGELTEEPKFLLTALVTEKHTNMPASGFEGLLHDNEEAWGLLESYHEDDVAFVDEHIQLAKDCAKRGYWK